MKKGISILLLAVVFACSYKEHDNISDIINGSRMLSIVMGGNLQNFIDLIDSAGYKLTDSTFNYQFAEEITSKGGTIFYTAKDTTGSKNELRCSVKKGLDVSYLSFSTHNKQLFNKLKKQFIESGFRSYKKQVDIDGSITGYKKDSNPVDITMMTSEGKSYDIFIERKE